MIQINKIDSRVHLRTRNAHLEIFGSSFRRMRSLKQKPFFWRARRDAAVKKAPNSKFWIDYRQFFRFALESYVIHHLELRSYEFFPFLSFFIKLWIVQLCETANCFLNSFTGPKTIHNLEASTVQSLLVSINRPIPNLQNIHFIFLHCVLSIYLFLFLCRFFRLSNFI